MAQDFGALGLSSWLVSALKNVSIYKPTPIQRSCVGPILGGRDCIGGARTGSGKTCAFALPILQRLSEDPFGCFALVLTPTRELAIQIAEQFEALGTTINLRMATVVGGLDMLEQSATLSRRPHIVVATPGRLADIIRSNGEETIGGLRRCKYLVLDEADRLLDPCFADAIATCVALLPEQRQTLLFTATVTDAIRDLAKRTPKPGKQPPFLHEVSDEAGSLTTLPTTLSQYYQLVPAHLREPYLHELLSLEANKEKSCVVFCNRADTCELLRRTLRALDHRCTGLHAKLSQRERLDSLGRFRAGAARILVCTDVASRGLDIPSVEMVVNFDLPRDPDDYIHRVGRTARAGRQGESVSFVTQHDVELVHAIEERCALVSGAQEAKMQQYEGLEHDAVVDNLKATSRARRTAQVAMAEEGFGLKQDSRKAKLAEKASRSGKYSHQKAGKKASV
ncbi:Putative RNA helicase [Savitreella phatthalungensis]